MGIQNISEFQRTLNWPGSLRRVTNIYVFYSMHCRIFCKLRPTLSRSFLLLSKTVCWAGCDWPTFTSTRAPRHCHVIKIMNRCQRHSLRWHCLMSLNCEKSSKLSSLLKFAIDEFYSYFENLTVQYQLRQHSTRNQNTRNFWCLWNYETATSIRQRLLWVPLSNVQNMFTFGQHWTLINMCLL